MNLLPKRGITTVAQTVLRSFDEIPGPSTLPIVGGVHHYIPGIGSYDPKRLHIAGIEKYKKYGPIIKENLLGDEILFLYSPYMIESLMRAKTKWPARKSHQMLDYWRSHETPKKHDNGGILTVNGQPWAQIRSRFQRNFAMDFVKNLIPQGDETAIVLTRKLSGTFLDKVVERDFLAVLLAFGCDLAGSNLFGVRWHALDEIYEPDSLTQRLIRESTYFNRTVSEIDSSPRLWKLFPTPSYKKMRGAIDFIERVTNEQIEKAKKQNYITQNNRPVCLLNSWLKEEDYDDDMTELKTFLADLLLAAIDTTAYTLSFILYHLSVNEAVQNKLHQEIQQLLPNHKDSITEEILDRAHYLKKVMKESQRINPVSVGIGRLTTEDMMLGGFHIPKDTNIITMNQTICRLPEFVERPDEFIPERFDTNGTFKKLYPFTMMPFGHGPRACIGRRLAEQNMAIFLIRILQHYHLTWNGDRPLDNLTLSINEPDAPLRFALTPRRDRL